MARTDYQQQLTALRSDIVAMSELVLERYDQALSAFAEKDELLVKQVIEGDAEINMLYLKLESDCIDLFALQQPVAGDLRFIAASFKILTDLERIGDLAVNLAEYALAAHRDHHPEVEVMHIGTETAAMIRESMAAYEQNDSATARSVATRDDYIDALCERAGEALVKDLLRTEYDDEDGSVVDDVSRMLLTIRDLERVGDHAVNICARTVYMVEHDDELIY